MKIRLVFLGFCVLWATAVIGAPSNSATDDAESFANLTETTIEVEPVRYNGAQLWRVNYDDEHSKQTVSDLQRQFG